MSMLFRENKCLLKAACALAFLLTLSLTACDGDDEMSASRGNSNVIYCDYEPKIDCDDSYEVDGAYYTNTWCSSSPYYKCENNKWSLLPEGDVPPHGAIVMDPFPLSGRELIQRLSFKKCNAENEGLIDSVIHVAESKFDYEYTSYYKCEQGSWNTASKSVACDTAGVLPGDDCRIHDYCYRYLGDGDWDLIICLDNLLPECDTAGISVGAICTKKDCSIINRMGYGVETCLGHRTYIYMGDGIWKTLAYTENNGDRSNYADSSSAQWTKECTAENEGETEKHVYGIAPNVIELYYKCVDGKWTDLSETDYYCTTEKTEIGDTCSVKLGDSTRYYMFMNVDYYRGHFDLENIWVESTVDPVLGYCPQVVTKLRYVRTDEKYYYCDEGKWLEAGFVPHQYTDPRKEGLTDEEYDVLDLPKEASVGDRAGGLLENCFDNKKLKLGASDEWRYETYDYCLSQNYYRYRKDGSWTLETEEDLINDKHDGAPDCTPESEGAEYSYLPRSQFPGENYKRIAVRRNTITTDGSTKDVFYCDDELVGYIFGRFEKN